MNKDRLIDLIVLGFIFLFLFSFFEPALLLSQTTATGGDMGSHYPTGVYMKEVLLPHGQIMGWEQGNYAGFPIFYHYFPLTFILTALLSYLIPMQISFKIISVLGAFMLPLCAYFAFRALKYPFPIPAIAASFTLPFLFMEANSMWGANIPSNLAGEDSYSISFAILLIFFACLYKGIESKKWIILNAILVLLIGLSHGFTLILSEVIAIFFLFTKKDFFANFMYLFKTFGLGGLLLSFWFIPFIGTLPYVTEYVTRWGINSFWEVFPRILFPFLLLSIVAFLLNIFDRRTQYFGFLIAACLVLYAIAPNIGMLDIRLMPFIQFYTTIFAATLPLLFLQKLKSLQLMPIICAIAIILWVFPNVTFIKGWIKWNYEGVETKQSYKDFKAINDYLRQTPDGRVVYEHSPATNVFGTERAFENLPYFAKRKTLEGLYMQSSISSPFVFYIQSEISKVCSGPFPQYKYSHLDLPNAIAHLKIFNVTQYIVRSPEAKKMAREIPELKFEKLFGDYEIFRLTSNDGHYVVPLDYEPILLQTNNWKMDFFNWFRDKKINTVNLVYVKNPTQADLERFKFKSDSLEGMKSEIINHEKPQIKEEIKDQGIDFDTNLVGYPHLVKISYHPNWQVEGADKIYLVSPSFMLVYPTKTHVHMYFGKTAYNYAGELLSSIGLLILLISGIISIRNARKA